MNTQNTGSGFWGWRPFQGSSGALTPVQSTGTTKPITAPIANPLPGLSWVTHLFNGLFGTPATPGQRRSQ